MYLDYLRFKAAHASHEAFAEEGSIWLDAEGKFEREHLGTWLGEFLARLSEAAPEEGFQAAAARFARAATAHLGLAAATDHSA